MERPDFSRIYEEQMANLMDGRFDAPRLENMRTTCIGGAGLSTALVFLLLQTDMESTSLKLALFCAVVAIPAWIATWQMVEAYLFCGESSYKHFATLAGSGVGLLIFLAAALSLLLGMCALLWYLLPAAAVLFGVLCLAMSVYVYRHNEAVRGWSDRHGENDN